MKIHRFQLYFILSLISVNGFIVLPYVQIDFEHYFRLAQCQAKCTQRYGKLHKRRLNDGRIQKLFKNEDGDGKMCEQGCKRHTISFNREFGKNRTFFEDGVDFWFNSTISTHTNSSTINSVNVGCMNSRSGNEDEFDDTIEGILFIDINEHFIQPMKFIVQWKQRLHVNGWLEESGWITASIESDAQVQINGMIPGLQYQYIVTAVGPNGRLGQSVTSGWIEAIQSDKPLNAPIGSLKIETKFDSENGVSALVTWLNTPIQQHTVPTVPNDVVIAIDSCFYKITITNSTHVISSEFTTDNGIGYLFTNLQFSDEYSVSLNALSSINNPTISNYSPTLQAKFTTLSCNQIFGGGSLHCDPQPVRDLRVQIFLNGTAFIQWTPASEHHTILTYHLLLRTLTQTDFCKTDSINAYLDATSNSASVDIPMEYPCEYMIRLTNYDLMGREAYSDLKFSALTNSNHFRNINIFLLILPVLTILIVITILFKFCPCIYCDFCKIDPLESSKQVL